MSATPQSAPAPVRASRHPLVTVLSLLLVVLGLVIGGLGGWLLCLGGSAYYAIAGLGLLASGTLLFGNRRSGALLYALVFVGTLLWTWWESGSDYWRWVPRLGLVTALANAARAGFKTPVAQRGGRADAGVRGRLRPGLCPAWGSGRSPAVPGRRSQRRTGTYARYHGPAAG